MLLICNFIKNLCSIEVRSTIKQVSTENTNPGATKKVSGY